MHNCKVQEHEFILSVVNVLWQWGAHLQPTDLSKDVKTVLPLVSLCFETLGKEAPGEAGPGEPSSLSPWREGSSGTRLAVSQRQSCPACVCKGGCSVGVLRQDLSSLSTLPPPQLPQCHGAENSRSGDGGRVGESQMTQQIQLDASVPARPTWRSSRWCQPGPFTPTEQNCPC